MNGEHFTNMANIQQHFRFFSHVLIASSWTEWCFAFWYFISQSFKWKYCFVSALSCFFVCMPGGHTICWWKSAFRRWEWKKKNGWQRIFFTFFREIFYCDVLRNGHFARPYSYLLVFQNHISFIYSSVHSFSFSQNNYHVNGMLITIENQWYKMRKYQGIFFAMPSYSSCIGLNCDNDLAY